jgi:thiosulfate dehydrogenase (quinone)
MDFRFESVKIRLDPFASVVKSVSSVCEICKGKAHMDKAASDIAASESIFSGEAGTILLPLRLVLGWTYFSAFWRRLVLANKFRVDAPDYIGEKFNHFLPHALLVKPILAYFVVHPRLLWWKLLAFTLVEAVVGLGLMLGLCTRLMGVITSGLALGILLSAGWLGTTCVDEWQIGSLGIAGGIVLFAAGGGQYSLDRLITARQTRGPRKEFFRWPAALESIPALRFCRASVGFALLAFGITLATNQAFHGGVWGKLHSLSVKPKLILSDANRNGNALRFRVSRVEGADVYGSFVVAAVLRDGEGHTVASWTADQLAALPAEAIRNSRIARIKTGPHSLILPLGAEAAVTLQDAALSTVSPGQYELELVDVSGPAWKTTVDVH